MTMIEKMARAIHKCTTDVDWEGNKPCKNCAKIAKAAIEAMREAEADKIDPKKITLKGGMYRIINLHVSSYSIKLTNRMNTLITEYEDKEHKEALK